MRARMTPDLTLPSDGTVGVLAGRVWRPDLAGPSVVAIRNDGVYDISAAVATMRDLCEVDDPGRIVRSAAGERIGRLDEILANTPEATRDHAKPWLLVADRPAGGQGGRRDLRALDARARDRGAGEGRAGEGRRDPRHGREAARRRPAIAEARLAAGAGAEARADRSRARGRSISRSASARTPRSSPRRSRCRPSVTAWRPACIRARPGTIPSRRWCWWSRRKGRIVGATLGNDVNLRDFEGRSALLLSKAKDNNASAALGPFVRFFDDDLLARHCARAWTSRLTVDGARRLPAHRRVVDVRDRPRSGRSRRPRCSATDPPVSGRRRALSRHHVRADQGPRRAGHGLHPPRRRRRHDPRAGARQPRPTA